MDAPVRFVRSRDGTRIAYTVEGSGPPLLWLSTAWLSHVALYPTLPGVPQYLEQIARSRTLVRMDFRGTGMADREFEDHSPTALTDDLEAVVDHLRFDRVDIVAQAMRVAPAVRFANRRPETVRAMVFALPFGPHPVAVPGAGVPGLVELLRTNWGMWHEVQVQRLTGKPLEEVQDLCRYTQRCVDQRNFVAEIEAMEPVEEWALAGNVQCPVLVIYRKNALASQDDTINLAHQLPHGRVVHLAEGAGSPPFGSRPDLYLQAVEEFLGSVRQEGMAPVGASLTARELEVLRLLAAGQTEPEIGASLCISRATVSRHVMSIYTKLGVHRKAEAVAWAIRHGVD